MYESVCKICKVTKKPLLTGYGAPKHITRISQKHSEPLMHLHIDGYSAVKNKTNKQKTKANIQTKKGIN